MTSSSHYNRKLFYPSVSEAFIQQQYGLIRFNQFYGIAKSTKNFVQRLTRWKVLEGHDGCVNTVAWNDNGSLLLSGSDDYLLNIYNVYQNKLLHSIESGHQANIFSAKFLPCTSDTKIVSCSGDGVLHYNELGSVYGTNNFNCHSGTTYEVLVTPGDPNTFLSCGEDGTVRLFDLRVKNKCHCQECAEDILIDAKNAVTSLSVNPLTPYQLAAGCKDRIVRVFDRRTLGTSISTRSVKRSRGWMPGLISSFKPDIKKEFSCRVTSLQYSDNGEELLVSYCTDYVYLFDVKDERGTKLNLAAENSDGNHTNGFLSDSSEQLPPVKRLRLRGDWSDTGPTARPECDEERSSENSLMQRMSDMVTRYFETALARNTRRTSSSSNSSNSTNEAGTPQNRQVSEIASSNTNEHCEIRNSEPVEIDSNLNESSNVEPDDASITSMERDTSEESPDSLLSLDGPSVPERGPLNNEVEAAQPVLVDPQDIPQQTVDSVELTYDQNIPQQTVDSVELTYDQRCSFQQEVQESSNFFESSVDIDDAIGTSSSTSVVTHMTKEDICEREKAATRIQQFLRTVRDSKAQSDFTKEGIQGASKEIYLPQAKMVYKGHRNSRTMIKEANFWGNDYVLSGSDCGRIFIWDKHTGKCVMLLHGDTHVVNCVQPHPFDPILATSGIDHDIKIWAPISEEVADMSEINEVMHRNERMLEESRDTFTVPESFVLRILASFGEMRGLRRRRRPISAENDEEETGNESGDNNQDDIVSDHDFEDSREEE